MDTKQIIDLNFGEALGFYLHEKGLIDDPRDVGQAEIVREPAGGAEDDPYPAESHIRFITRSGEPQWQYVAVEPSPEEFLWELMKTMLRHPGFPVVT